MSPHLTREQAHALYIVDEHPTLTAAELAYYYNCECFDERFDDVPETTPNGMAARLSALRQRGLVVSDHSYEPVAWEITEDGQQAFRRAVACPPQGDQA